MLDHVLVRQALDQLAAELAATGVVSAPIEVLLVGGAGGLLAGELPAHRTTVDCDIMCCTPLDAMPDLRAAAAIVATALDLPERWLNDGSRAFCEALLPGWTERRTRVMVSGVLHVYVPARVDFIATKVIAGRPQDLEDLESLAVTDAEWRFVRHHLEHWTHDHWPASLLSAALRTVDDFLGESETVS